MATAIEQIETAKDKIEQTRSRNRRKDVYPTNLINNDHVENQVLVNQLLANFIKDGRFAGKSNKTKWMV
jgi:hypothetical protein